MSQPSRKLVVAASLFAVVGLPVSVWAQEGAAASAPEAAAKPAPGGEPRDGLSFNFKEAPVDQVLDVFAREAGVPVIFEAAMPQGQITFVSSSRYTFREALSILNLNLARLGVHLRHEGQYLYLATLQDAAKRPVAVPTAPGALANLTPDEIVTVSIPLDNARVEQVAEQVKTLIGPYGGVLAIPTQNMLVVVESAAQVRRIREVVSTIDARKPADAAFRLFPLRHAQAETVLNSLKGLVGERQKTVIVDKDGSQRTVQETQLQGLNLIADPRTNSIIAVGPEARIRTVEEVLALLDVPAAEAGDGQLATFVLSTITADAAAARLTSLFSKVEGKTRPVVLALPEVMKVTVVGAPDMLAQAAAVIAEMDPGAARSDGATPGTPAGAAPERRAVSVRLKHLPAATVEQLASRLLTPRQMQTMRFASAPDGKSVIIVGPTSEVASFEQVIAGLDIQDAQERDVRLVRVSAETGAASMERARSLYEQSGKNTTDPVTAIVDGSSATLIGTRAGLAAFTDLLTQVEAQAAVQEVRRFEVNKTLPSALAGRLSRLARPLLAPTDGTAYVEPTFESMDEARVLVVRAQPRQMGVIEGLIAQLDAEDPSQRQLRMIELRQAKAADVAGVLTDLVSRSRTLRGESGPEPAFEAIEATNTVIIAARPEQMGMIEALARDLDQRQGAERPPLRLFRLKATDAASVAGVIQRSFDGRPADQRAARPVWVDADAATNTLIVSAHPDTLPEIEGIIATLNEATLVDATGREIRIYPLKVARAEELAQTIDQMYPEPPMPIDPRTRQPRPDLRQPREIVVRADRATNSLIVDAPAARMAGFEQLVRSLDQQKLADNVTLRTYRVERADLNSVAGTIRQLVSGGSLVSKSSNAPITVTTEPVTRTLVVSGPTDVFAGVEEVLAKVDAVPDLPPTEMKLYALVAARAERIQPVVERVLAQRAKEAKREDGTPLATAERIVEVTADGPSNTLIVSAPREVISIADGLVRALDQQSVASAVEVRVFRLTKGEAASVANAVRSAVTAQDKPGAAPATVTAEPASNTLVVVGTAEQLERAGALVENLDQAVDREGMGVRTIQLKHARAETLAPVLEGVLARESALDRMPDWMRAQVISRLGGDREPMKVRVLAEPRLNALVVSGPRSLMDLAEQMVTALDVSPADGAAGRRAIRIITLKNADAVQAASNLEAVFKDSQSPDPAPVVRVDGASNSLILRGSDEQLAEAEAIVAKLDAAAVASTRQMRMVPVDPSRADAELMARTLRRLLEQQGGVKVEVITAEELLKRGTAKPTEEAPKRTGMIHPAWTALAAWAMGVMEPGTEPQAGEAQPAAEGAAAQPPAEDDAGVTIAVDPATNTLMIVGSPRMTDRLAALVGQLQSQMPAEPSSVRLVSIPTSMDAPTLAQVVNQTVSQLGRMSPANPGGFTGAVTITPDPTGSALIVVCNQTDFETVGALIASMSQLGSTATMAVKVYPLVNTTAPRAMAALRDLFTASPAGMQARRVRAWEIEVRGEDGTVSGRIDPSQIRITTDPAGASVIVAAPGDALAVIDKLIETVDQSPVTARVAIRRYALSNAKAGEVSRTLQSLFDAQRQAAGATDGPAARFIADDRTNSLMVAASEPQHRDVGRLLAMITLKNAAPTTVQRIVEEIVVGRDPAKKDRVRVSAQDGSDLLIVRAPKEDLDQVRAVVSQVDQAQTGGAPVRSIKLERADASAVAQSLQKFFSDRAALAARPGSRSTSRVAVVGDKRSSTLLVAAGDEDFAQVQELVKTFDTPAPSRDLQFKVVALRHARVADITQTIKTVLDELRWDSITPWWAGPQQQGNDSKVYVEGNERANSVVLVGQGDAIETAEKVIQTLDQPEAARSAMAIKSVKVRSADLRALQTVLRQAFVTPGWRSWRGPDPEAVTVEIDRTQKSLILVGKSERVEEAARYIAELDKGDGPDGGGGNKIEAISLAHARADRAAQSLRQFFADRARAQGVDGPTVSLIGSADGNVLIVSAPEDELGVVRDLIGQIDQPDGGKDRRIEVFVVRNGVAGDLASSLRTMFARDTRGDERVVITPQPSTNSVIVSAPQAVFPEVAALLKQLDAAPRADETNIETVSLTTARAQEVATALRTALPANVKVTVTPVTRSNSLMLTGSKEAIAIAMEQIKKIDQEPVRSGQVFRRFRLTSAEAGDVSYTVGQLLRARPRSATDAETSIDYSRTDNTVTVYAPADQIDEIEKIIRELDQAPEEERTTEFVRLEYANATQAAEALRVFYGRYASEAASPAARNVTILPDKLSNSLVIRADKTQWEGVRALLTKLDTKEYDTTRQLEVIALEHADAASVARALNDGLRAPLEEQLRQSQARAAANRGGQGQRPGERPEATVLVDAEGVPSVSAEPQTNSLIIFAGRRELDRIREIVRQLDVSGFGDMPQPRLIALRHGKPTAVAATIREMYLNKMERATGPRSVMIVGHDPTGALIVRADDEKFAQIRALAETLEQQGEIGRVQPHVVRLKSIAAGRLRQTLLATFTETAKSQGETLAVEVDRTNNALVIACSGRLLEEIKRVIAELDEPTSGAGVGDALTQNLTIVDVTNNDPADIRRMLEEMGLTRPAPPDRPGVVSEPVQISVMTTRRALAVVGAPADGRVVEALVKSLDASPLDVEQRIAVVPLKVASARALAATLTTMLRPGDDTTSVNATGPAGPLAEQIRRLQLVRPGVEQSKEAVDLTKPIRLMGDDQTNTLIIASTQANIDAIRDVVKLMDTLPVGDAVVMRIFPLENASAARVKAVVDSLFQQGEALRRLPGTTRRGLPPTTTGQALAGEVAIAVDERTNTLIGAGREEALALVEVLVNQLDSDAASKWVEPLILPLKFADAASMARKLEAVLVRGTAATPEALGLQRQFGRLRLVNQGRSFTTPPEPQARLTPGIDPQDEPAGRASAGVIESDLFAPITGLVITSDDVMNALIVVGSPANLAVVKGLVEQLDVEAASAANAVRLFPLRYAAADRVAGVLREIFSQRRQSGADRPEDALIISTDVRTNALIVSSSQKSFAIVESLLKTLDGEKATFSVGIHVVPVEGGDVRQLAPRIERLMRERLQASAQAGSVRSPLDAFTIEAEPSSNLLIVACSQENLQIVRELVSALTEDVARLAAGQRSDIIQLAKARATEAADSVQQLYADKENQRRGPNSVRVVPNERLNALVATGTEEDLIEIRSIVRKLDSAQVATKQVIKSMELRSANAGEVVRLVENVLAGRPVGGGRGVASRQATRLEFFRDTLRGDLQGRFGQPPTEAEIDGALRDQVTLTADARTNAVWITAPEALSNLITEMITDIERSSAGQRKIEKFRLVNADAARMRDLLRDIFNLRQQGDALVLVPAGNRDEQGSPAAPGLDGETVTPVPDERQQLAIAVDLRTNTLIVSGTPEYLELVRKVVTELDAISANERERRVYHLRNAKAKDIETTLKSYFQGEADKARITLGNERAGSLLSRLESEVTVVGDQSSNKLVISTSPKYMESVLQIVEELDASPPQVMIQVLLAEVTVDAADQWGMDINVGPFGGESYRVGSTAAGVGVATALGVPNLSVSSTDFSLLIRALEAQGKLEVLSNPQVLANNNQVARISVVDEIGVAGRSQFGGTNNTSIISEVERIPAGIILEVTPSISSDGFVRMEISPEISALTSRVTQINRDQTAPVITKRTVDTVVTVKDGQSVVIGGLIQTSDEQRTSKVPLLGDIPIIGVPFRTKKNEVTKTELLVILTPRVVPGQAGATEGLIKDVTEQSVDRMEDPTRIEDYLERIRLEVEQTRRRNGRVPLVPAEAPGQPAPAQPPASPPADPALPIPQTSAGTPPRSER
jgi:type II secretion system protein D